MKIKTDYFSRHKNGAEKSGIRPDCFMEIRELKDGRK
jgi:hypothetical protein